MDDHLHPSDQIIEHLVAGSGFAVDEQQVRGHLVDCLHCRQRVDAARLDRERFDRQTLPRILRRVDERLAMDERNTERGARLAIPAFAAAALILLLVAPRISGRWGGAGASSPAMEERDRRAFDHVGVTAKGGTLLQVFARRDERVFAVHDGTPLRAGDRIRFVVHAPLDGWFLVASIDGEGQINVYYPFGGARSEPISPRSDAELPGSIELDGARGPERIFAVLSREALPVEVVRAALKDVWIGGPSAIRQTRRLDVPSLEQASILIEKEAL